MTCIVVKWSKNDNTDSKIVVTCVMYCMSSSLLNLVRPKVCILNAPIFNEFVDDGRAKSNRTKKPKADCTMIAVKNTTLIQLTVISLRFHL